MDLGSEGLRCWAYGLGLRLGIFGSLRPLRAADGVVAALQVVADDARVDEEGSSRWPPRTAGFGGFGMEGFVGNPRGVDF